LAGFLLEDYDIDENGHCQKTSSNRTNSEVFTTPSNAIKTNYVPHLSGASIDHRKTVSIVTTIKIRGIITSLRFFLHGTPREL
jgi:hypothetical protein